MGISVVEARKAGTRQDCDRRDRTSAGARCEDATSRGRGKVDAGIGARIDDVVVGVLELHGHGTEGGARRRGARQPGVVKTSWLADPVLLVRLKFAVPLTPEVVAETV